MSIFESYAELEEKIEINNAPSLSKLVNFNSNLKTPIHRWYYFKEGFSHKLVEKMIDEFFRNNGTNEILDPFCGSATTLVTAQTHKIRSAGIEVNPFLAFVSRVKTNNHVNIPSFTKDSKNIITRSETLVNKNLEAPGLSSFTKVFERDNLQKILAINNVVMKIPNKKNKGLLKLALASIIEESSKIKRYGKGLRFIEKDDKDPFQLFSEKCSIITEDLEKCNNRVSSTVKNQDARKIDNFCGNKTNLVIFSPPYLNSFDYNEIYKLELWLLGFVKNYPQFNKLSKKNLRSHLSGEYNTNGFDNQLVNEIVQKLKMQPLWNNKIPDMIKAYFSDMNDVFCGLNRILKTNTTVVYVVGNSSYGGVPIATDLLLADIAQKNNFIVEEMRIARKLSTSPQQLKKYSKNRKKYLRESLVVLQKI
jgi:hypothetical protein